MREGTIRILKRTLTQPTTVEELAALSGYSHASAHTFTKIYRANREIRICAYKKLGNSSNWVAYYELNPEKLDDVPRPTPSKQGQKSKAYRDRKEVRSKPVKVSNPTIDLFNAFFSKTHTQETHSEP